jgi:hypothetical protein
MDTKTDIDQEIKTSAETLTKQETNTTISDSTLVSIVRTTQTTESAKDVTPLPLKKTVSFHNEIEVLNSLEIEQKYQRTDQRKSSKCCIII